MIDLSSRTAAFLLTQTAPTDPGTAWLKDHAIAIDAPPDEDTDPGPDARWPQQARRSGLCGAVSPRVVTSGGGYRMYYTQILPRPGFPAGANDYENATTRILSATSPDGSEWTPEPGVRLPPQLEQGELRVVSSEVVPVHGHPDRLRMYYESANGLQSEPSAIHSALSEDGGLTWNREAGARLASGICNYGAPRILFLTDGRIRLYCYERGLGIVSAVSNDGLTFRQESGIRIEQGGVHDAITAFAPEIVRLDDGSLVLYYAGYSAPNRAYVLRATSADEGLTWQKDAHPILSPGGVWDGAKCSEMCVFRLPDDGSGVPRYRMLYEACDGTAENERGVWRIASATSER